jgi:hypothetical protein
MIVADDSARVWHFVRAPEHLRRHRTTARVALILALAGTLAGSALAVPGDRLDEPDRIVFPIVGPAQWTDDFGAPRPQGAHEGNDILSDWKAPVVAVEAGKIRIWNRDGGGAAGCMLYLEGRSGATYIYIHLNNDLTAKNDGKGGCKPGVSFAPGLEDEQRVRAGELIGYVGSSGDAGATNHLHFEHHPGGGGAVSPFRLLRRAERPLYVLSDAELADARATAEAITLTVAGTVESVEASPAPEAEQPVEEPPADPAEPVQPDQATSPPPPQQQPVVIGSRAFGGGTLVLTIDTSEVRLSTGATFTVERTLSVAVSADAVVERRKGDRTKPAKLDGAVSGEIVTVTTGPIEPSLDSQLGRPGTLPVAAVLMQGVPES